MCSKVEPRKLRAYICPRGFGKLARRRSTSTDDSCCSNLSISIKTRVELALSWSRQTQRSHKPSTKLKKDNLAAGADGTCEFIRSVFPDKLSRLEHLPIAGARRFPARWCPLRHS